VTPLLAGQTGPGVTGRRRRTEYRLVMARRKLDTADARTRASLARGAAELGSAARAVEDRTIAIRVAVRAAEVARRDYAEAWEDLAATVRAAHEAGLSVAEMSRITGYGPGFIRPLALGLVRAPRPQGRRPRQADDRA
jgi:hypothetical protein